MTTNHTNNGDTGMTERIQAHRIFGDVHDGNCCDCCAGYCLASDIPTRLWDITDTTGAHLITDRYVAVLADLVDVDSGFDVEVIEKTVGRADVGGGQSTEWLNLAWADRLLRLGFEIREGGAGNPQPLTLNGEYAGLIMPRVHRATAPELTRYHATLADLDLVRTIDRQHRPGFSATDADDLFVAQEILRIARTLRADGLLDAAVSS